MTSGIQARMGITKAREETRCVRDKPCEGRDHVREEMCKGRAMQGKGCAREEMHKGRDA